MATLFEWMRQTFELTGLQLIGVVVTSGAGGFAALARVICWQWSREQQDAERDRSIRGLSNAVRVLNNHQGELEAAFYRNKNRGMVPPIVDDRPPVVIPYPGIN
jgi:hypothetical protein